MGDGALDATLDGIDQRRSEPGGRNDGMYRADLEGGNERNEPTRPHPRSIDALLRGAKQCVAVLAFARDDSRYLFFTANSTLL